jgi:hypothetical protein
MRKEIEETVGEGQTHDNELCPGPAGTPEARDMMRWMGSGEPGDGVGFERRSVRETACCGGPRSPERRKNCPSIGISRKMDRKANALEVHPSTIPAGTRSCDLPKVAK